MRVKNCIETLSKPLGHISGFHQYFYCDISVVASLERSSSLSASGRPAALLLLTTGGREITSQPDWERIQSDNVGTVLERLVQSD